MNIETIYSLLDEQGKEIKEGQQIPQRYIEVKKQD
jgi:hypothetical protein